MGLPSGATRMCKAEGMRGPMPDGSQIGRSAVRPALLTLPNVITFARLCAVPLSVWLVLEHRFAQASSCSSPPALSDAVDGWLARRNGGGNAVGALLDPVADKALLVTMYVTLAAVKVLPDWLAILVVFRDVVIVGGVVVLSLLGQAVLIRPLYVSKLNTALQIVLVAVSLLLAGFGLAAPVADDGADLARRGHHAGLRRGLCLGHGPPPMTDGNYRRSSATARGAPDLVRRAPRTDPRPGDARPAGRAGGRPAGGGLAGAAAVRLGPGAVRRRGRHRLCARPADHAADPARDSAAALAALLMILALLAGVLLFALLLYPLILQQIGLLLGRIPQYVQLLQRWASEVSPTCSRISAPTW